MTDKKNIETVIRLVELCCSPDQIGSAERRTQMLGIAAIGSNALAQEHCGVSLNELTLALSKKERAICRQVQDELMRLRAESTGSRVATFIEGYAVAPKRVRHL